MTVREFETGPSRQPATAAAQAFCRAKRRNGGADRQYIIYQQNAKLVNPQTLSGAVGGTKLIPAVPSAKAAVAAHLRTLPILDAVFGQKAVLSTEVTLTTISARNSPAASGSPISRGAKGGRVIRAA